MTKGLIFLTDEDIIASEYYAQPKIISIAPLSAYSKFKKMDSIATNGTTSAILTHTFVERCYVFDPIIPLYYTFLGLWTVALITWCVYNYGIMDK